jgi:hypothetical protein
MRVMEKQLDQRNRIPWAQGVAGSNPAAPTNLFKQFKETKGSSLGLCVQLCV